MTRSTNGTLTTEQNLYPIELYNFLKRESKASSAPLVGEETCVVDLSDPSIAADPEISGFLATSDQAVYRSLNRDKVAHLVSLVQSGNWKDALFEEPHHLDYAITAFIEKNVSLDDLIYLIQVAQFKSFRQEKYARKELQSDLLNNLNLEIIRQIDPIFDLDEESLNENQEELNKLGNFHNTVFYFSSGRGYEIESVISPAVHRVLTEKHFGNKLPVLGDITVDQMETLIRNRTRPLLLILPNRDGKFPHKKVHKVNLTAFQTMKHDLIHLHYLNYGGEVLFNAVFALIDHLRAQLNVHWSYEIWTLMDTFFMSEKSDYMIFSWYCFFLDRLKERFISNNQLSVFGWLFFLYLQNNKETWKPSLISDIEETPPRRLQDDTNAYLALEQVKKDLQLLTQFWEQLRLLPTAQQVLALMYLAQDNPAKSTFAKVNASTPVELVKVVHKQPLEISNNIHHDPTKMRNTIHVRFFNSIIHSAQDLPPLDSIVENSSLSAGM